MIFKKVLKKVAIGLSLLMAAQFTFANAPLTQANAATGTVSFGGVPTAIKVGDTFTVSVNVNGAVDLYGASLDLSYDSSVIQVSNPATGAFMNGALNPVNDLEAGKLEYGVTFKGTATNGVNGNGTAITFQVKMLKEGDAKCNALVKLSNYNSEALAPTVAPLVIKTTTNPVTALQPGKHEETATGITYTGTGWSSQAAGSYSAGSAKLASVVNNSYEFTFYGSAVRVLGIGSPTTGIAKVTIDGVSTTVDTYRAATTFNLPLLVKNNLTLGNHTVKVEVTGTKNANSKGTLVGLDVVEVFQNAFPADAIEAGTHQEYDARIKYTGAWTTQSARGYFGGSGKLSSTAGNTVSINFIGTGIRLTTIKSPVMGKATVTLDGQVIGTYDGYDAKTIFYILMAEKQNLAWGVHNITIKVEGTKNALSKGTTVALDRIEITK